MSEIQVFDDALELANKFCEYFLELAKSYEKQNKTFHIALSGGSTPKLLFKILKEQYLNKINWKNIHFYWGDERMVSSKSKESNYGEAYRILLNSAEIPQENIHPVLGDKDIIQETERYSNLLFKNLYKRDNFPAFDLIILGMGDDGHTASIFPDQMSLLNSNNVCEPASHPVSGQIRITLTKKTINNAEQIAFLITGANKAKILDCIFNKKEGYELYPAAHMKPSKGSLKFFVDLKAAKYLK